MDRHAVADLGELQLVQQEVAHKLDRLVKGEPAVGGEERGEWIRVGGNSSLSSRKWRTHSTGAYNVGV